MIRKFSFIKALMSCISNCNTIAYCCVKFVFNLSKPADYNQIVCLLKYFGAVVQIKINGI